MRNIQSDTKSTWSRSAAANEIKQDIKSFLNQYSQKSAKLEGVLDSFIDSRQKEGGIRKLAKWGKAMGLLIKFLPDEVIQEFRGKIDEVAHKMGNDAKFCQSHFAFVRRGRCYAGMADVSPALLQAPGVRGDESIYSPQAQ